MRILAAVLAAPLMTLPARAGAEPLTGPYVGFTTGLGIPQQEVLKSSDGGTARFTPAPGATESLSTGWKFGNGFRVELEGRHLP
jgi:hypothetical protein